MQGANHNAPQGMSTEALTDWRLGRIEEAVTKMADSMNQFVLLEQKHADTREGLGRAFKDIESLEVRVREVELRMPGLALVDGRLCKIEEVMPSVKMSSTWLSTAMTIVGTALVTGITAILLPHVMK
jgi:hypothetical protein